MLSSRPAGPRGEAGADAAGSPAGLLEVLGGVDGAGSGLDADLLDGLSSAAFQRPGDAVGGDLTGTAAAPSIAANAVIGTTIKDKAVTPAKLGVMPAARLVKTASVGVASGEPYSDNPLRFDGEVYDGLDMHAPSGTTQDIAIAMTGIYETSCSVPFGGGSTGTLRGVRIQATGGTAEAVATSEVPPSSSGVVLSVTGDVFLTAGQTLQCQVRNDQTGGNVIPAGATFSARWTGPKD